jgi:hypothetical protein
MTQGGKKAGMIRARVCLDATIVGLHVARGLAQLTLPCVLRTPGLQFQERCFAQPYRIAVDEPGQRACLGPALKFFILNKRGGGFKHTLERKCTYAHRREVNRQVKEPDTKAGTRGSCIPQHHPQPCRATAFARKRSEAA